MPDTLAANWGNVLHVLLAPIVIVAAIGSLLLGLQRSYTSVAERVRALNAQRRSGDNTGPALRLMALSARLRTRAVELLYLGSILFLLCACALGIAFSKNITVLAYVGFTFFLSGALALASALVYLLRDVPLWLRALDEEIRIQDEKQGRGA